MVNHHLRQLVSWHQSNDVTTQLDNICVENEWQQISTRGSWPLDSKKKMMVVWRERAAKQNRTKSPKCDTAAYFQILYCYLQMQVNLSQLKWVYNH